MQVAQTGGLLLEYVEQKATAWIHFEPPEVESKTYPC